MRIGKQRWRCRVEMDDRYGALTNYQWFDERKGFWRDSVHWPRYDANDSNEGLPKSLAKLYRVHQRPILQALVDGQEQWLTGHPDAPDYVRSHVATSLKKNRAALQKL